MKTAKAYAVSHGLTTVEQAFAPGFTDKKRYKGDQIAEGRVFQKAFSEAYAARTSGKVYLLMPHSAMPFCDSIFYANEFKTIKEGGRVEKIIWLDYPTTPADPATVATTWWETGGADPPCNPHVRVPPGP
jgi:hypothetical protein